ncbi:signal peptidase I [Microbacterium ureisolvens]|uniref:signal peptidase I n=1 Tax=Microbacterium ureisolvens TaxID=2781186 RepID=UPI00363201DA
MTDPAAPAGRHWRRLTGSAWFHLIVAFVLVGLVLSFVAKPYRVPSVSMEHALQPGDLVLVNRLAFAGTPPNTGDVIVFDAGDAWDSEIDSSGDPLRWLGEATGFGPSSPHTLVKRVIGSSGQTVECCSADGRVMIDGAAMHEPYVTNDPAFQAGVLDCETTPRSRRCFDPVLVPVNSYLVLGDNRGSSSDSAARCRTEQSTAACWRWAAHDGIVGKAAVILWPIDRWAAL